MVKEKASAAKTGSIWTPAPSAVKSTKSSIGFLFPLQMVLCTCFTPIGLGSQADCCRYKDASLLQRAPAQPRGSRSARTASVRYGQGEEVYRRARGEEEVRAALFIQYAFISAAVCLQYLHKFVNLWMHSCFLFCMHFCWFSNISFRIFFILKHCRVCKDLFQFA